MRFLLLFSCLAACRPQAVTQDTAAVFPPCEPPATRFVLPVSPSGDAIAVEHHLAACIDTDAARARLTVRRTSVDDTCTASVTFDLTDDMACPDCEKAWVVGEPLLDSDCVALADATPGPEDVRAEGWIGYHLDGTVVGEMGGSPLRLDAEGFDYRFEQEGPITWIDVYGTLSDGR